MALHDCHYTFEELTLEIFPKYFDCLLTAMESPIHLNDIYTRPNIITSRAGCYVICAGRNPVYVGIAKNISNRILSHLTPNPTTANLAVRMVAKRLNVSLKAVKKLSNFNEEFVKSIQELKTYNLSYVEIDNSLEMYIFEPYCAMKLNTQTFNFFDTLQVLRPKY